MIKFGYLDGYNAINVPKFVSADARDMAFDSYTTYSIDAYYPPYYTNVIKVDVSDVPQTTPINFVILVHNDKYYYYFTDKIRYINEDIYEIVINMDTVLTYMFDYIVKNGFITRKSINRWVYEDNVYKINRNYVRENVSEGIMEVSSFEYRNANKYLIVASSKRYYTGSPNTPAYIVNNSRFDIGYNVYIFPLPPFLASSSTLIHFYSNNGNTHIADMYYDMNIVSYFIDDPNTINMTICESEYLDKVLGTQWSLSSSGAYLVVVPAILDDALVQISGVYKMGFNSPSLNIDDNLIFTDNLGFTRNTVTDTPFNYTYVPQLIDENYIQLEYGDINGFSSYPLHQSKSASFNYYNNLDITNGNDGYFISDNLTTNNVHKTYTISLGLSFDLISDKWLEYQSVNKGTLSTGIQLQAVNTLYSTAKGVIMPTATKMFNDTRALQYFEQGKQGLSDVYANQSYRNHQQVATGTTDGIMQGLNVIANYQINKENLEYAPDTVKGRANIFSMLFSRYKKPYLKKFMVSDIINCAKKLEEYGYKVNEVINISTYMHTLCNNRFYYNCISARVTIYDTLCFIPNEIINDINARLENGLRFFTFNDDTSNYTINDMLKLDNVENDVL